MPRSRARRRYNVAASLLMASYALILFGVILYFKRHGPTGPTAWLIAILPALPIIGVFVIMGRYLVEEGDEYRRMLMVRQALIATGFALSIATAYGFLENFGLVHRVNSYWAAILWFFGLGVGGCLNRLAERGNET